MKQAHKTFPASLLPYQSKGLSSPGPETLATLKVVAGLILEAKSQLGTKSGHGLEPVVRNSDRR
jgi:hypothetical protein